MNDKATKTVQIIRYQGRQTNEENDLLAVEEPLEIGLIVDGVRQPAVVTMRTPGQDLELAAGFLYAEGLIQGRDDLAKLEPCVDPDLSEEKRMNRVDVALRTPSDRALEVLQRSFTISSACGVCGKTSLDALELCTKGPLRLDWSLNAQTIESLQKNLRDAQKVFAQTGGLHAAALFDSKGRLLEIREDVGRHNAVDKVLGSAVLADSMPLNRHILMVSGRSSFEILQKAFVAEIPVVCSVSAPSSLAVDLAQRFNITLVGFLREDRFNVYSAPERVVA
jgi:FdhD protein